MDFEIVFNGYDLSCDDMINVVCNGEIAATGNNTVCHNDNCTVNVHCAPVSKMCPIPGNP